MRACEWFELIGTLLIIIGVSMWSYAAASILCGLIVMIIANEMDSKEKDKKKDKKNGS